VGLLLRQENYFRKEPNQFFNRLASNGLSKEIAASIDRTRVILLKGADMD